LFTLTFKWPVRYVQVTRIASADGLTHKAKKVAVVIESRGCESPLSWVSSKAVIVGGEELRRRSLMWHSH